MTNPLVVVRRVVRDEVSIGRNLWIWCPGCDAAHAPSVVGEDGSMPDGPTWQWNGATDETFTISPSLLCHGSVHICAGQHDDVVCPNPDSCGQSGHLILNAKSGARGNELPAPGDRVLGHPSPHTADPAWGNCHSFIVNGQWQFLGDCAHALAGQTVPMVPVPDWLIR